MALGDNTRQITIKFKGDVKDLAPAVAEANAELDTLNKKADQLGITFGNTSTQSSKTEDGMTRLGNAAEKLGSSLGKLTAPASYVTAFEGIVSVSHDVIGAIAPMAGLFGLLPGAIGVGAAALLTFKAGAAGVSAALKGSLTPETTAISSVFQKDLAPSAKVLSGLFKDMNPAIEGVAKSEADLVKGLISTAATKSNVAGLNTILGATKTAVDDVGRALDPLESAFIQAAAVAAPIFAKLTGGIDAWATNLASKITTAASDGRLAAWIDKGIKGFDDFKDDVVNIFEYIKPIVESFAGIKFSGLSEYAPIIQRLLIDVGNFLTAHPNVAPYIAGISLAAGKAGPLISGAASAFKALGLSMDGLTFSVALGGIALVATALYNAWKTSSTFRDTVSNLFQDIENTLKPELPILKSFVTDFVDDLTNDIVILAPPFAKFVTASLPVFVNLINTGFGFLKAFMPLFTGLVQGLTWMLTNLPGVNTFAADFFTIWAVGKITGITGALGNMAKAVAGVGTASSGGKGAAGLVGAGESAAEGGGIGDLTKGSSLLGFGAAGAASFGASSLAVPVVGVWTGFGLLAANAFKTGFAGGGVGSGNTFFQEATGATAAENVAKEWANAARNGWLKGLAPLGDDMSTELSKVGTALLNASPPVITRMGVFGQGLVNSLATSLAGADPVTKTAIANVGGVLDGSRVLASTAGSAFGNSAVSGIGAALSGGPGVARSWATNIGAALSNGLGNTYGIGSSAGSSLISGLASELRSGQDLVGKIAQNITQTLAANKGPISRDRVLWKPAGQAIVAGLITTLQAGLPSVKSTATQFTDLLASVGGQMVTNGAWKGTGAAAVAAASTAPATASSSAGGYAVIEADFGEGIKQRLRVERKQTVSAAVRKGARK